MTAGIWTHAVWFQSPGFSSLFTIHLLQPKQLIHFIIKCIWLKWRLWFLKFSLILNFKKILWIREECSKVIPASGTEITSNIMLFVQKHWGARPSRLHLPCAFTCMSWRLFSGDSHAVKHLAITVWFENGFKRLPFPIILIIHFGR